MNFIIYRKSLYSLENVKKIEITDMDTYKRTSKGQPYKIYTQRLTISYFGGDSAQIDFRECLSMTALENEINRVFNEICEKLK